MKRVLFLLILFYCQLPGIYCQSFVKTQDDNYWQQQVNYKIDVALNDADHTLDGYVKMDYFNNSPDTLYFIWIHLWPNAYKNDRTAFSDQILENGNTGFYFSNNDKKGYINRLDFKVNYNTAKTEDHPQHQDIIKLILPQPLAPKTSCKIETPFHVKLPYNFSRGGHIDQSYQITQWYPKPAVYDRRGWHPIPYLDQGEFYSEFGNFEVQITVPKNYVVAATGNLQEQDEKEWLKKRKVFFRDDYIKEKKKNEKAKIKEELIASSRQSKTLHYLQNNVHDFAWFADKTFSVKTDAFQLPSGRTITAYAFYYAENEETWSRSIALIKQAVLTKSKWIGEYPYDVVSVVDNAAAISGGMEYPTIILVTSGGSEAGLERVINHEAGHNWFYGILASNERDFPWMDEGMNTFYDRRYATLYYNAKDGNIFVPKNKFLKNRLPAYPEKMLLQTIINIKKDQPVNTVSEKFSSLNYKLVSYEKAGEWMQLLEKEIGKDLFDSCMRAYYRHWSFKHPYPEDFKKVLEEASGKKLDSTFALLNKKGALVNTTPKKDIHFSTFFNFKETDKHHYIFIAPVIGYNFYDKQMPGIILHNYTLPASRLQFVVTPIYSFKSKKINGIARVGYSWYPGNNGQKAELSVAGSSFNGDIYTDSTNKINFLHFLKIVPSLKSVFANKNPRSSVIKFIQWKTFLFNEQQLLFTRDQVLQIDVITYPFKSRYINQLQFVIENNRVLYPYKGAVQIEQGDGFVRTNFTGNYYFNYAKGGGMNLRLFAGKFFYTGNKTFLKQFETDRYHLNMTGPKGYEDYTYSNYFVGRNEYAKFSTQQIMIRDGGFKVRTDLLSSKIGKTDDWLAAANFTTSIPEAVNPLQVLPVKIPLKIFLDMGTYAEAWKKNAATGRFIYDAGLQLSLFKNVINIYVPLLYSKVYSNYFKSTIPQGRFVKNIAFSIDIQNLSVRKLIPQLPF